ncbi:hypothetical protein AQUCO_11500015v1 [Aquilegia coerulea]|uniref:Uncharacterized protein n=1 Tax=Aquilegia coerulea TaxID=218851 RepID=A0A2G5C299_AQUCA|nr:hypothetical protein AQUCO_11500015v1 [Aquilegia coerulea]
MERNGSRVDPMSAIMVHESAYNNFIAKSSKSTKPKSDFKKDDNLYVVSNSDWALLYRLSAKECERLQKANIDLQEKFNKASCNLSTISDNFCFEDNGVLQTKVDSLEQRLRHCAEDYMLQGEL